MKLESTSTRLRPQILINYHDNTANTSAAYKEICKDIEAKNKPNRAIAPDKSKSSGRQDHFNILSKTSKRKIRTSLEIMTILNKKRTRVVELPDVRIAPPAVFITLTLPSKQKHATREITKKCLGLFLQNMRDKFSISNYVWVAEYQKNSNIHYHLIIDRPVSFGIIRLVWNRSIEKLGYISDYRNRMSVLTMEQYLKLRNPKTKAEKRTCKDAYHKGVLEGWSSPNSTDVKVLKSAKLMGAYITKYMSKGVTLEQYDRTDIRERDGGTYALWGRSQTLSRAQFPKMPFIELLADPLLSQVFNHTELIVKDDFFEVHRITNLPYELRKLYNKYIRDHITLCY